MDELPIGESRWPPIVAVALFMAVNIIVRMWLPHSGVAHSPWLMPTVEGLMLLVLLTSNPGNARERQRLRRVSLVLVGLLVFAALWGTGVLISDLIRGAGVSNSPSELLASGGEVWLGNIIAFAMLYWLVDGGGPLARKSLRTPVDFAFTQHLSPEVAPAGWKPVFLDYLHLGFTNATAFSPTDVMPLTHRMKYAMVVQSTVALALFGLVIARAVNAFT
ncbi:hypothetical protein [Solirubrobacter soli]|uniref:hypothetical protein n=1 Tax=Solirubrobacter soli TaxID=363832 RepID=UPI0003F8945F|nr:hypothetical protein [Solirubrobacter soli]